MATTAEKLAAAEAAIDAFIDDKAIQSYTLHGVTIERTALKELDEYARGLRSRLARETLHGRVYADRRGYR